MDKIPQEKPSDAYGAFWDYISKPQRDLLLEGNYLMNTVIKNSDHIFHDYSFLVFPFAKAFEGYLKKICFEVKFISHLDYISDHLRLGKLLSPNLADRLGDRSLYVKFREQANSELADMVWDTWRLGRNEIFHYFPHNLRSISFSQAEQIIAQLIETMEQTYIGLEPLLKKKSLSVQS